MTQTQYEPPTINHHTVVLGPLARSGEAQIEITTTEESGEVRTRTLLVPAGLPNERVTIAVEEPPKPRPGRKRRHWKPRPPRVWITEIHEASPLRTTAPCPVFGPCGGCQLQHMQYEKQLEWKRDVVQQLLLDVGGFTNPPLLNTVPCDVPWHYRNHMRFSVNRDGQPGLTVRGTHRVLPLTNCPIAHEQINQVLEVVSQHQNARPQVLIRTATTSKQTLIQPTQNDEVTEQLQAVGLDIQTDTMEETLAGQTYRIRPSSFFQTNTAQAEKMVSMILAGLLEDQPDEKASQLTVVDAYCGVGTFAAVMAKHVEKVIAIEESASAIKDAQWNTRDLTNVEIIKGKVEDMLPGLSEQIDGFVIDPPRAGCMPVVLDALLKHPVERIVYVSCEPSTLARDLRILCQQHPTYHLRSIQPLDMFPHTAHIESVAVLERRNS
ncbi:MAG TPA: class I SAM-dependent RNA methyltransferase [Dictyobacter sp.]|jgi:23S rRNA (uracil1939-C5)-methyltransferase|nr:class I SAM-dependent RNA methyltransferase [Dictyobacter sp.]